MQHHTRYLDAKEALLHSIENDITAKVQPVLEAALEKTVDLLEDETAEREAALTPLNDTLHAAIGEVLFMRTIARSGKVKRLRNDDRVTLAPCTWEGEITGPAVEGRGRVLAEDDPLCLHANDLLDAKYGEERAKMTRMMEEQSEPLLYLELRPR